MWNNVTGWSDWNSGEWNSSVIFNLSSIGDNYNCTHYIEYYAIDDLGNNYTEPLNQTVYVDNSPPVSQVNIGDPSYYNADEQMWFVRTDTPIWINTSENYSDNNACDSGYQYFHWEAYIWNESMNDWQMCNISVWNGTAWRNESTGNETGNTLKFHFNEECYHKIVYYGVDNLGNYRRQETEFKVDDTPPFVEIEISSGPSVNYYVTTHTYLRIHAEDRGACPVES